MKPHLLMLLLLAIPPLISNILACENAEKTDPAPATEKSLPVPAKETPAAVATPAPAPAPAPAAAKPAPSHGAGSATGLKVWDIM
jgi:hypothetical protein